MTKTRGTAKPSERLRAAKSKATEALKAPAAESGLPIAATKMKVATKFVVVDKTEVPVVVGHDLVSRFHVKLEAVYEARPIFNGLATVQGNADNRIFGDDKPEAVIGMVIESKAIADTFMVGHAFSVVFTDAD